jgi:hypothetical protein
MSGNLHHFRDRRGHARLTPKTGPVGGLPRRATDRDRGKPCGGFSCARLPKALRLAVLERGVVAAVPAYHEIERVILDADDDLINQCSHDPLPGLRRHTRRGPGQL